MSYARRITAACTPSPVMVRVFYFDHKPLLKRLMIWYGAKEFQGDLNQLRFKLLAENGRTGRQLPPNKFQINYQTKLRKQAEQANMDHPAPESHGWEHVVGKGYIPTYFKPAEQSSANPFVSNKCKTGCLSNRCQCRRGAAKCSDLCGWLEYIGLF